MPTSWKPETYSTVSPYLIVNDAAATIDFLREAFGAEELRRFASHDGGIVHAEARIGDTVLMIADGAAPAWPPVPAHVHVYVPDVDATYETALAAGATPVQAPVQKEDEDRRGGVKDPGGTTWWIATRVG
jgi:PhnB protein